MAIEIHLPDIGTDAADVTEILVSIGEQVEVDTPLISVEGDKAAMEIPSPKSGTVKEIKIAVGDSVSTDTLILILNPNEEDEPDKIECQTVQGEKELDKPNIISKELHLPDVGADEVTVTEIHVEVGDQVEIEQPIISVEGDKAAMEIPSTHSGKIIKISVAIGESISSGVKVLVMETVELPDIKKVNSAPSSTPQNQDLRQTSDQKQVQQSIKRTGGFVENQEFAHASPSVRRIAREFGVNLANVRGSGRKGRIIKEDVQNYVKEALRVLESGDSGEGLGLLPWPDVDFNQFGETETEKLSKIKKLTGGNLHRNWVRIPHVTQWDELDVTELEALRKKLNTSEAKKESGIKFTLLVFVMKAVAKALQKLPPMNSSLSNDEQSIILKKYVNIGIAVNTPNGLVVPVVRNVHEKNCLQLTKDLRDLSSKARDGKLTKNDITGGTFTISSLGGLGGTSFTPIINAPEVGILGLSRTDQKPVWNNDTFVARLMLPMSLSYDHRVIDGAEGVNFLNLLKETIVTVKEELEAQ